MQGRNNVPNLIYDNAKLNETIKNVVRLSRKLYLDSLNAMFAVRRSGDVAGGFVAVTSQLRTLSTQIGNAMLRLQQDVEALLQVATRVQRQRHLAGLARAALRQCDNHNGFAPFKQRIDERLHQGDEELGLAHEQMGRRLRDALRICMIGNSLAVVAKIEASQSGALAATLGQVAAEVEYTVMVMTDTLNTLGRGFAAEKIAA